MSHIYQPVMIKTLLLEGGMADKNLIATKILEYDFSQVEYYEKITNNMVGRVLRNHEIVVKEKDKYILNEFEKLNQEEIEVNEGGIYTVKVSNINNCFSERIINVNTSQQAIIDAIKIEDFGRRAILAAKQTLGARINDLKKNILLEIPLRW